MTFHDYLLQNLQSIVMITLTIDNFEPVQYNKWNWLHEIFQFHLIRDDGSIGHIILPGKVTINEDGSVDYSSEYHPNKIKMNFYFGGAIN